MPNGFKSILPSFSRTKFVSFCILSCDAKVVSFAFALLAHVSAEMCRYIIKLSSVFSFEFILSTTAIAFVRICWNVLFDDVRSANGDANLVRNLFISGGYNGWISARLVRTNAVKKEDKNTNAAWLATVNAIFTILRLFLSIDWVIETVFSPIDALVWLVLLSFIIFNLSVAQKSSNIRKNGRWKWSKMHETVRWTSAQSNMHKVKSKREKEMWIRWFIMVLDLQTEIVNRDFQRNSRITRADCHKIETRWMWTNPE